MDDVLRFLLQALYCFTDILKEKFVQLTEFRDIYGRKCAFFPRRTEKRKEVSVLFVLKYASAIVE